jgi:nucleoid-associated protein YgaU
MEVRMKRLYVLVLLLLAGSGASEEPPTLSRIEAMAKEIISQGAELEAKIKKMASFSLNTKEKAIDVIERIPLEEKIKGERLLGEEKRQDPAFIASLRDAEKVRKADLFGTKAKDRANVVTKMSKDALMLIEEAVSISQEVLRLIKEKKPAPSLLNKLLNMTEEANEILKKASFLTDEMEKEISLASMDAARADYYTLHLQKEKVGEEEIIAKLFEEEPLIRTSNVPPLGRRIPKEVVMGGVVYEVVKTDCLWFIAERFYKNPFLWPKIFEANKDKIKDPHWIYPKQRFIIPEIRIKEEE